MKTAKQWEEDILQITMKIQHEYPELSKYIKEMPVKNDHNGISTNQLQEYHNSLDELISAYAKTHAKSKNSEKEGLSGYPLYPPSEDIYVQGKKVMKLDPNDLSKNKAPNQKEGSMNEKDFAHDMPGDDLDVPGSELDDQQESVGSEDEENNHYSNGSDKHNDLEENTH
jgi:hypothetical protein